MPTAPPHPTSELAHSAVRKRGLKKPRRATLSVSVMGIILVAWAAYQLGVLVRPDEPSDYVTEIRVAARAGCWLEPREESVTALTRAARDIWPGSGAIQSISSEMARAISVRAREMANTDERGAKELARAAAELDESVAQQFPSLRSLLVEDRDSANRTTSGTPQAQMWFDPSPIQQRDTGALPPDDSGGAPQEHLLERSLPRQPWD